MEKLKMEEVIEILRKKDFELSQMQAALLLDFLRMLANIVVSEYLQNQENI